MQRETMKKLGNIPATLFTPAQLRRIETSIDIKENRGSIDQAIFQHSVLCSVFFPYKNPGDDKLVWSRELNKASLHINAFAEENKETGGVKSYGLPYGANARLIMAYINTVATKQQDPVISLGDNLNRFLEALGKSNKDGRTRKSVINQLNRITNSTLKIDFEEKDKDGNIIRKKGEYLRIIKKYDLWHAKTAQEKFLFPSYIELDSDYFENLKNHSIPLDERAVFALAQDAMALDIYTWLANRLPNIKDRYSVPIKWASLKLQFGGYSRMNDFKVRFRKKLAKVLSVYPDAKVEEVHNKKIIIHKSPPPISRKSQFLIK